MVKRIMELVNNNFKDKDIFAVYTYDLEYMPKSKERVILDIKSNIRRIKELIKMNGIKEFKYIAFIDTEGVKGNRVYRYYIILSDVINSDMLEDMWEKGICTTHRLKANELKYNRLIRWILKGGRSCVLDNLEIKGEDLCIYLKEYLAK